MPHDGKVIRRIYRGGRCYYIASPYSPEATQALKAAFPQYWTAIYDYGYAHPQLVPFINEDPMLIVSLVEVGKTRWLHAIDNLRVYIDVWTATDLNIVTKCATDGTTGGNNDTICGALSWNSSWNKCDVGSFLIGFDKRNGLSFCYGTERNWFNAIYSRNVKENTPYILDADYSRFIAYNINGSKLVEQKNTYYWTEGSERQMQMMGVGVIVYDCKIYKNGELYRHIVPFQGTDGACLVDVVNGTRYYPSTEGSFTIQLTDKT